MSLSQVLIILWRRGWIIALAFVAAATASLGVLTLVPGRYDAVATASVDFGGGAADQLLGLSSSAIGVGLMQGNLLQLVQSERVALDVVKRLHLTSNPATQAAYRASDSFGREGIDEWMAQSIARGVDPKFNIGSNVLTIKYKSGDQSQAALIANAFLGATIDATIAMKAAQADQAARWFEPQIESLRKEFQAARTRLEEFQAKSNIALPTASAADAESATLAAVTQDLSGSRAALAVLKSRLESPSVNLSTDPSDPDVQWVNGLKERLAAAETELAAAKTNLGPNNPRMQMAASNITSLRKQLDDATLKLKDHLKDRIAQTEGQIHSLEAAQAVAQTDLIAAQARRDQLLELQRDVAFRLDQLNQRQSAEEQAKLQSKLTFAGIAVLDKADPPISPAFPKPMMVIPVGLGGGLVLGLILALMAEMMDRRIRMQSDLEFATSAPVLGVIRRSSRIPRRRNRLLPA